MWSNDQSISNTWELRRCIESQALPRLSESNPEDKHDLVCFVSMFKFKGHWCEAVICQIWPSVRITQLAYYNIHRLLGPNPRISDLVGLSRIQEFNFLVSSQGTILC